MEYATLEFVANCLDCIRETRGDTRPYSRLYRRDQKLLIQRALGALTDQLLRGIATEGDHAGWQIQKQFLVALIEKRYQRAFDLLPALGVFTDIPFLGDCPAAERILPPE